MKKVYFLLLAFLSVFLISCSSDDEDDGVFRGEGTKEEPFLIRSATDLIRLAEYINEGNISTSAYYKLTSDIDLNNRGDGSGWIPIGNNKKPFKGEFDGNNHTIKNLTIRRPGNSYQGLFGYSNGIIKRVNLTNVNITGGSYTGGVVGWTKSSIQECSVSGNISGSGIPYVTVGGLVGYSNGLIKNCYTVGSVSGSTSSLTITSYIGGLVGRSDNVISNCYSAANVSGSNIGSHYMFMGGLAGSAFSVSNSLTSSNSIKGSGKKIQSGRIAASFSSISNSYINKLTSITGYTQPYLWDVLKVSETTSMLSRDFYINTLKWDMDNIWYMKNDGTLPVLK